MTGDRSMTLDERVEAAARAMAWPHADLEDLSHAKAEFYRIKARQVIKAALPELFDGTGWIAPWEASDDMVRACLPESLGEIIERGFEEDFAFMRDAHLKANAPQGGAE